jgi:DNA repair exonuclease SbcCD nuclease subunit
MVKFLHTADLHLDTPFSGLCRRAPVKAEKMKHANLRVLDTITDVAVAEAVDFVVMAGDVFNAQEKSLAAKWTLLKNLKRLAKHGIKVYITCGNHDPWPYWRDHLQLPPNTHLFLPGEAQVIYHYNAVNEAIAQIMGVSHESEEESTNLAGTFPEGDAQLPTVAILHGNLVGCAEHAPYAPFTLADLKKAHIDYWALGHIHQAQILNEAHPTVIYPGNPQGRDFSETGRKGCYLITLEQKKPARYQFYPCMAVKFSVEAVDITGIDTETQLQDRLMEAMQHYDEEGISYCLRLRLCGCTSLHSQLSDPSYGEQLVETIEAHLSGHNEIFLDTIEMATLPAMDISAWENRADFIGELFTTLKVWQQDSTQWASLEQQLRTEMPSLPDLQFPPKLAIAEQEALMEQVRWLLYRTLNEGST